MGKEGILLGTLFPQHVWEAWAVQSPGEEDVSEQEDLDKSWNCGDQPEQSEWQDGSGDPVGLVVASQEVSARQALMPGC